VINFDLLSQIAFYFTNNQMNQGFVLVLMLVAATNSFVDACSCMYRTDCEHLDQAEHVALATITKVGTYQEENDSLQYDARVDKVFKSSGSELKEGQSIVITTGHPAMCGQSYDNDGIYLVTLRSSDNNSSAFSTSNCDLNRKFEDVNDDLKTALDNGAICANQPTDCAAVQCAAGQVCQVTEVQCVRAPCPPVVSCVDRCTIEACSSAVPSVPVEIPDVAVALLFAAYFAVY
jgi:hypothetical protein